MYDYLIYIMKAKLVCYSLENSDQVTRTRLQRELYGYKDYSNHGKYENTRKGLLNNLEHKRITDGVILIAEQHANKLTNLLKKNKAKIHLFEVINQVKI